MPRCSIEFVITTNIQRVATEPTQFLVDPATPEGASSGLSVASAVKCKKTAEALLSHPEDAADHNLPLMYWYAIEPLADVDPARALALALNAKVPQLLPFMIRRLGSSGKTDIMALLIDGLSKSAEGPPQVTFLTALRESLKGRRQVDMPKAWPKLFDLHKESKDRQVRDQSASLAVTFGQPQSALDILLDAKNDADSRGIVLAALIDGQHPKLSGTIHGLLGANLAVDYLLENIIDPSAVIPKEYAATIVELKNGRVITGILRTETPVALTLLTANESLTLPRQEIDSFKTSNISMMPDDILPKLKEVEIRALIAYLQGRTQVPLLDNAK